ncbi:hypothetical protein C8R43DRAFT_1118178 [Mycena crocata]|nr:hypothetical protein C8R43DRAFT_1118178 [Mycena crocata]
MASAVDIKDAFSVRDLEPTASDIAEIRLQIALATRDVIDLEEEFMRASSAVADVVARRAARRMQVQVLKSILAPIRRIPAEILAEIFGHCVRGEAPSCITNPRAAPLLLGRVCGFWRNVSMSTPILWTNVGPKLPLSHIDEIFRRSGGAPLFLSVDRTYLAFEDVVLPVQTRLRDLALRLDMKHDALTTSEDYHFPILRAVRIRLYVEQVRGDRFVRDNISALFDVFARSPQLSVLFLDVCPRNPLWLPVPSDRFPWRQLKSLCLHTRVPLSWMQRILPLCLLIESLQVYNLARETPDIVEAGIIVLSSRLSSLTVGADSPLDLTRFFASFSFPGLQRMEVNMERSQMVDSELARLSGCSLEKLTLRGIRFVNPELLLTFLGTVPSVTSLSLQHCSGPGLYDALFRALNSRMSSLLLLSRLTDLHVVGSKEGMEGSIVAEMLQSRIRLPDDSPLSQLENVKFKVDI